MDALILNLKNAVSNTVRGFRGSFEKNVAQKLISEFLFCFVNKTDLTQEDTDLALSFANKYADDLFKADWDYEIYEVFEQFVTYTARDLVYGRCLKASGLIVAAKLKFHYPNETGKIYCVESDRFIDPFDDSEEYYSKYRMYFPDDEVYFRPKDDESSNVYYHHYNCPEPVVLRRNTVENKIYQDRKGFVPWIRYEKFYQ